MRKIAKLFTGPGMLLAGINHFVMPKTYEVIVPDYLPAHRALVYASGVTEAAGAAMTLHPATRKWGGLLLLATLAGVFPANLHMALHPDRYPQFPQAGLWGRLPLQLVMAYWVWLAALKKD